jgi:ABC-type phosphate/phosphonate transport system substrate-binding protein
MLDLEKRTPEQQKVAENAIKDGNLLSELLSGLLSKKSATRYKNFKVVYLISEEHPEVMYPKWDFFEDMLKSKDNGLKFQAIHVLANLSKVDTASRFEKVFDQFYDIVNGDALIPASHVAYVSHKIVKAKPELANKITERLLNLGKATYKHKELVQANALRSFSEYFDRITDKDKIVCLAKELQKNKSSRAKKEATEFLKKWKIK